MGQEMNEVLSLKQKREDNLSLLGLDCLAIQYDQQSKLAFSDTNSFISIDSNDIKDKLLPLSEGIYLHPVSILDDRELSTNCIHITQNNMDILYDTLPENIFFICY